MGKKQKQSRPRTEEFNDKPAYAADFLELRQPNQAASKAKSGVNRKETGKAGPSDEAAAQLRDRINDQTMQQLVQLKAAMKAQETERGAAGKGKDAGNESPVISPSGKRATNASGKSSGAAAVNKTVADGDKDKSFKELFDPEPESEKTFEDLFKDSKLDWRSFK